MGDLAEVNKTGSAVKRRHKTRRKNVPAILGVMTQTDKSAHAYYLHTCTKTFAHTY